MPATFSASTCIDSNTASLGPFNIYLDDSYSTPFSSATFTELTNCPFIIVVPTGTTTLYFKDTIKNFCFETPIQDNNICSNCKLGLSNYSATTTSRLYCGFLTGSCQNITDYVIHWYGPNDTTTLAKKTGFGSVFQTEYDITHQFLGTNYDIALPSAGSFSLTNVNSFNLKGGAIRTSTGSTLIDANTSTTAGATLTLSTKDNVAGSGAGLVITGNTTTSQIVGSATGHYLCLTLPDPTTGLPRVYKLALFNP